MAKKGAIDPTKLRLGRKPGVVHDRRTLRIANYVDLSALPPLPLSARTGSGLVWNMLGNDKYGDCGKAAQVHLKHSVARTATEPSAQKVIDAYLRYTGGADTGVYLLDLLNDWRREDDGVSGKIVAFGALDLTNRHLIHAACWLFGGLVGGASLPITAQEQVANGKKWTVVGDGKTGDSRPGSWGGHAFYVDASFSASQDLDLVTWGMRQRLDWNWAMTYIDELYAVIHPAWFRKAGKTPAGGLDMDALMGDLALVTA